MDRKYGESGAMTDHDSRTYLAWANSFSRLMRLLGLEGPVERGPTLAEILVETPPGPPPAAATPHRPARRRRLRPSQRRVGRMSALPLASRPQAFATPRHGPGWSAHLPPATPEANELLAALEAASGKQAAKGSA
jgi:hypothetical protein